MNAKDYGITPKPKRHFLGKTDNFKDRGEKVFYQRMLKAYHNGRTYFCFGFNHNGTPKEHAVLQNPQQEPFKVRGNGIANQSKYPLYTIPFYRRCGKNMTKA